MTENELFRVNSPKGHEFVLKPVQCPHHTNIMKIDNFINMVKNQINEDKQI